MYLDKDAILNSLTKDDVIQIVTSLGSSYPKTDSNGDLIFQSVCHGSDSWKLYYYHEPNEEKGYKGGRSIVIQNVQIVSTLLN